MAPEGGSGLPRAAGEARDHHGNWEQSGRHVTPNFQHGNVTSYHSLGRHLMQ